MNQTNATARAIIATVAHKWNDGKSLYSELEHGHNGRHTDGVLLVNRLEEVEDKIIKTDSVRSQMDVLFVDDVYRYLIIVRQFLTMESLAITREKLRGR